MVKKFTCPHEGKVGIYFEAAAMVAVPVFLGHGGTTPGLNFIYIPLNHILKEHDLDFTTSDAIDRVPSLGHRAAYAQQALRDKLIERKQYLAKHGGELPEIGSWKWSGK